jgi:hypothetical protein
MRLGQGRENVRDFLRQNLDLLEEIAGKVKVQALPPVTPVVEADTNGAAPPVAIG